MSDANFEYEKDKLKEIIDNLEETLEGEELKLKVLPKKYGYDPRLLQSLMSMASQKISGIKNHIDRPYFARIDFKNSKDEKREKLYIGKVGVIDLDGEIIITDWRAPISSLYYDSNLGNAKYTAPEGIIEGELELKRQIVIENRELLEIFDVDSVSDDELLKPYLGANADNRLKNIVASIQKEQNDIIRRPLYNNVIVQGVAGSGKTTVALHRIAYLMYNYSKTYMSNQFMVIGPNKFFINYISNVLPDLDAGQVVQYTFEELATTYIAEKMTVKDPTQNLVSILLGESTSLTSKYKLSMSYKEEIDTFIDEFENHFISEDGICINGFCVFTKKQILEFLSSAVDVDFASNLLRARKIIETKINDNEDLSEDIKKYFANRIEKAKTEKEKSEILKLQWDTLEKINKSLKTYLDKIFNIKNQRTINLYKKFITNYKKYSKNENITEVLKQDTLKNINKKEFDFEDLPALMYIKLKIFGSGDFKEFAHVVVDESQDFGTFNFFVLKSLMSNSTFSIFGDLTQGIYEYRSIENWEEVVKSSFDDKCEIMLLEKSYRTTIEIMESANLVSKFIGLFEGKPVIRHGNKVTLNKVASKDMINYILDNITKYEKIGHKSISIICKTPKEGEIVYKELVKKNKDISLISEDNEIYNRGICVVPAHLSKGLEFDCVLIYNADENVYSSNDMIDMKLLYVAMTRALHILDIVYQDNVTKPLLNLK